MLIAQPALLLRQATKKAKKEKFLQAPCLKTQSRFVMLVWPLVELPRCARFYSYSHSDTPAPQWCLWLNLAQASTRAVVLVHWCSAASQTRTAPPQRPAKSLVLDRSVLWPGAHLRTHTHTRTTHSIAHQFLFQCSVTSVHLGVLQQRPNRSRMRR